MLLKKGINTSYEKKTGPNVKEGIATPKDKKHTRSVVCSGCGARLEKQCHNEMMCEISVLKCPKCGASVS